MTFIAVFAALLAPAIIFIVAVFAFSRKIDPFATLVAGAKTGFSTTMTILPNLIGLLAAVYMLRASGALDVLSYAVTPLFNLLGVPPELAPLAIIRPISGSGGLAAASELIQRAGPDSDAGRMAAVMMASSETTFYVTALYFGSTGVIRTRYAIPAALVAELTSFAASVAAVKLLF